MASECCGSGKPSWPDRPGAVLCDRGWRRDGLCRSIPAVHPKKVSGKKAGFFSAGTGSNFYNNGISTESYQDILFQLDNDDNDTLLIEPDDGCFIDSVVAADGNRQEGLLSRVAGRIYGAVYSMLRP